MESINFLIDKLLDNKTSRRYCNKCYEDDSYISDSYLKDQVTEEKISALLKKSYTIVALICEACKIKASQFFLKF